MIASFCFLAFVVAVLCEDTEQIDAALLRDYVKVPGGRSLHKSCVHHAPDGSVVSRDAAKNLIIQEADGTRTVHPSCPHKAFFTNGAKKQSFRREKRDDVEDAAIESSEQLTHGPAWKAWTQFNATAAVTSFATTWRVPGTPKRNDLQILYFWNGVEPLDNSAVLQPVLQWGYTPAGGGAYWAIASWYVSSSNVVYTNLSNCGAAGTTVIGTLKMGAGNNWQIIGACNGNAQTLTYNPSSDPAYTWAYPCVLEAYDISNCVGDYPPYQGSSGSLTFTGIELEVRGKPMTTTWTPQTKDNTCGENANAISQTSVQITWQ